MDKLLNKRSNLSSALTFDSLMQQWQIFETPPTSKNISECMESTDKLFLFHWRSCLFLGHRFVSGKRFYCWCSVLHSTETFDLATWPGLKAKSLSVGCEIVLLTSSSFKTCVHLLHVVIVNQALRLCSFSSFPSAICFFLLCVLYYCVAYITSPWGNVHVCVITNIKSWL